MVYCAVALMMVVGFTAAPVAAAGGDGPLDVGDDGPVDVDLDPEGGVGVGVGGEEGVDVGAGQDGLNASVGGDRGVDVDAGQDGVDAEAGGDKGVDVGVGTDEGVEVGVQNESVGVGPDGVDAGDESLGDGDVLASEADADAESNIDVTVVETNSPVDAGETLTATAELQAEDSVDSTTVEFVIEGDVGGATVVDSKEVSVDDEEDVTLEWQTERQDFAVGNYEATVVAGDGDDSFSATVGFATAEDEPFPEERCTDVLGEVGGQAPFEQLPWVTDLPDDLQPPGVPWDVATPGAIYGIASSAAPNQCEVFDPNDPPYDPITGGDEVDPAADVTVQEFGGWQGGPLAVVSYDVTLNESGNGPGASGTVGGAANGEFGDLDSKLTVEDGEKAYGVDPRFRYQKGGKALKAGNNVELYGQRLGVVVDCDGEECQPGTRGLPNFFGYPAGPSPSPAIEPVLEIYDTAPSEEFFGALDELPAEQGVNSVPVTEIVDQLSTALDEVPTSTSPGGGLPTGQELQIVDTDEGVMLVDETAGDSVLLVDETESD